MTKKETQLSGAQKERNATLAHVRRRLNAMKTETNRDGEFPSEASAEMRAFEKWLMSRAYRFNARPVGLGKKPKTVGASFDAIGIP